MAQLIELTNRSGLDYLQAMLARGQNLRPVLAEIGEDMTESAKRRFTTTKAHDGTPWAPNSATTIARYGDLFARKKDGTRGKKVEAKIAGKKPLTGETRALTVPYSLMNTGLSLVVSSSLQLGRKCSSVA